MTTAYRPGIKNIVMHLFFALWTGAGLFHMVFIRPLSVGERAGPTGAEHTRLSIVLTYAAATLVMLYCIYEGIAMIRMRRSLGRNRAATQDVCTECCASLSDIVGRILGAVFCGCCLLYFVALGPMGAGSTHRTLVGGAGSFRFESLMIDVGIGFLLVYFVGETVVMLRARYRSRPKEGTARAARSEES